MRDGEGEVCVTYRDSGPNASRPTPALLAKATKPYSNVSSDRGGTQKRLKFHDRLTCPAIKQAIARTPVLNEELSNIPQGDPSTSNALRVTQTFD